MKDLARLLCDYLCKFYGDVALVTPQAFANALRIVGEIPQDASPAFLEHWIGRYAVVRLNAADESLPGWTRVEGADVVIETGKGRSREERNITLVHEFAEYLRTDINAALIERGSPPIEWKDRYWDAVAVEILAPLAEFRRAAQQNGLDLIDLFRPLSFESVVHRFKDAFEDHMPLFCVYHRNDSPWVQRPGHREEDWRVAASSWTKRWLRYGYHDGRETLRLPRRGASLSPGSRVDEARRRHHAALVQTADIAGDRVVETTVLIRPRVVSGRVAQMLTVGLERSYGHMLVPQLQLVAPDAQEDSFHQLF